MWHKLDVRIPVEDEIIPTTISGIKIFVTLAQGNFYAVKDECPHEGIKLSLGCIKSNTIKCSLHGFSFDLSSTQCDEPEAEGITTYPIKLENEVLWIQMN